MKNQITMSKKYFVGLMFAATLLIAYQVQSAMLNADGTVRPQKWTIEHLVEHCEMNGYFIYDEKLFMCAKIRNEVTRDELKSYTTNELKKYGLRL